MYRDIALSASLMCIDWLQAGAQLRELEAAGIDYLHYDIIDGHFAPDFTMGSSIINCFRENTRLRSDYHLMVEEPNRMLGAFKAGPEDYYTIHQECARNLHRDLVKIKQSGTRVGVALSPGTPLDVLEYVIEDVDLVLLMTVDPGYMGQPLVPQVLRKIEKLKALLQRSRLEVRISVDGNINAQTIPDMVAAGADTLVLGSSGLLRKDVPIAATVEKLHEAIDEGLATREPSSLYDMALAQPEVA
jgi:ribulose-phosphate 3-epimerase